MGEISRRTLMQGAAVLGAASALAPVRALAANDPPQVGVVGKVKIPWFDNVEKGVLQAGTDLGVDATHDQPDHRRPGGAGARHRGSHRQAGRRHRRRPERRQGPRAGAEDRRIAISMDGKGAWRDNVFVERLWRTVKYEEVYLRAYAGVSQARASIGRYLGFYNGKRPHSSLGGNTPDQAYINLATPIPAAA